jgi:hypothetical protein
MLRFSLLLLFTISTFNSFAQTEAITTNSVSSTKRKGNFYLMWGYTRCWYSKSTIHFKDHSNKYYPETGRYHDYDFTIYDAKAKDRPDFDAIKDVVNITIPQFVVHAGYYFNNKKDFGIEINYDHAKYVVTNYQKVHIKGNFNGDYVDKDTILDPDNLLHFEHTDGANFWMVNFVKRWKLYEPSKKFNVGYVVKPGAGIVYPRTDVTMFGTRLNNNWHIAGWIVGIESGLRVEFLKNGVFEFVAKGVYADYRKCLVLGKGNGTANHHFFAGQLTMTLGACF